MGSSTLWSDILTLSIYLASLGAGYFVAIVLGSEKLDALVFAKELGEGSRIKIYLLALFAAGVCHFIGVIVGNEMVDFLGADLFSEISPLPRVRIIGSITIISVVAGTGAWYGTSNIIRELWKERFGNSQRAEDPSDPPFQGPLKGA